MSFDLSQRKLGIIAGGGDLPSQIVSDCQEKGRPYFVLAFKGQTDPKFVNTQEAGTTEWVRVGAIGQAIEALHRAEVLDLVMVGHFRRPSWLELRPDAQGAKWMARMARQALGDDGLLRIVVEELEKEGFRIVGADSLIGDRVLATAGIMGVHGLSADIEKDILRGVSVAQALGTVDVGQSVVVQQGLVLGVEAIEGTDQLLARCAEVRRGGDGGVLVKIAKPGQERRVDLPTIGLQTIESAHKAGLRGIALEAEGVMIVNREKVIEKANACGILLYGIDLATGSLPAAQEAAQ